MQDKINLSPIAEEIARFLAEQYPQYTASAIQIQEVIGCDKDECQKVIIELMDEGLVEDFAKSSNTYRISMVRITRQGRIAVKNNFVCQNRGPTIMENNKYEITLGDGNVIQSSNLLVATTIENSFNRVDSANISDELKNLLKELAIAVGEMSEALSPEEAKQVARDLETLTAEATSEKPRRKWWQLSVEELEKAATNVGKIGIPVITLAHQIATILSQMPAN